MTGKLTVRCRDTWGDGWHGGFLEVTDHIGTPPYQFCADFTSGRIQTEVLPEIDLCNHQVSAAPISPGKEPEEYPLWYGVSEMTFAVLGSAVTTWARLNPASPVGMIAENAFWAAEGGLRVAFGIDSLSTGGAGVNDNQRRMGVAKEVNALLKDSLEEVYADMNQMQSSLQGCVMRTFETLGMELSDVEAALQREMDEKDYHNTLEAVVFQSQNRLATVVDFLEEGQGASWLSAPVSEGLQSCLDIDSLTSQVSETSIAAVMASMAFVNAWFNTCRSFVLLARALAYDGGAEVPFKALYSTEKVMGEKFSGFYSAVNRVSPETSGAIRPFALEVQNYLNLVKAQNQHAINSLTFPHRQGGLTEQTGAPYHREYSLGAVRHYTETCRFCQSDGDRKIHYGCWEEQAISADRCMSQGGIYYNSPLSQSNEYRCRQYQYGHWMNCGGRPQQ
jgi:hypothetical protein